MLLILPQRHAREEHELTMPIPIEKAIQMVRTAHGEAVRLDIAVTAVVVDESGREWWMFQELETELWYLHGLYD